MLKEMTMNEMQDVNGGNWATDILKGVATEVVIEAAKAWYNDPPNPDPALAAMMNGA
ncbi:MAG: hypothetical protein ACRCYY_13770 [Trueperaceae bacterium]